MIADVRADLAELLRAALGGTVQVYDHPPAAVIPPALVLVPDEPYAELAAIGRDPVRLHLSFRLTAVVSPLDAPASLDRLERLLVAALAAMPGGVKAGAMTRPGLTTVGTSELLVSDVQLMVAANVPVAELLPEPPPPADPDPDPDPFHYLEADLEADPATVEDPDA